MKIILAERFLSDSKNLPPTIQHRLARQIALLEQNPFHMMLHTKRLHGKLTGSFSFRITRDFRAIFYFENPNTIWIVRVANRKDIYK